MTQLADKVAIVTGGGTGIGKGIAKRLHSEGATVVVNGIDSVRTVSNQYRTKNLGGFTAAQEVAADLSELGGEASAIEADVTDQAQVDMLIKKTVQAYGRVDLLVHCAGIITSKPVVELTQDDWDSIMTTNAKGTFLMNQAAAKQMLIQGGGKIINISSIAGKQGYAGLAHYSASKFAVLGFTQALARELIKDNITVNAICPGIVGTAMWQMLRQDFAEPGESEEDSYQRNVDAFIPQGVPQTEEDMATAVMFLAVSDHVTGQAINVDGGCVM